VTIEIRPVDPSEAVAYLTVLPFANGLPSWEPAPAAWHGGTEAWPPPRNPASPQELESWAAEVTGEGFHSMAAFADGKLVGGSAMLALKVTVPGLTSVPMGGVTSTGVIATHRRRGLLRAMMRAMIDQARERGELLAGLSASEGSIYGRFGFSPATVRTRWELDRRDAAFAAGDPPAGSLELADAAAAREAWPEIHEQARRGRVGGLSDEASGTAGPVRYLVHRDPQGRTDGIANYRLPWSPSVENIGTLVVEDFQALSPDAYRAMWMLLTDFDLTRKIVAPSRPADEPLRWMLRNPRAMRITRQSDNLWLRILDLPRALEARSYDCAVDLTIAIEADAMCPHNAGVWHLDASPAGATCSRADAPADLTMDVQSLASLYLGGMSASVLAGAGRIRPHRENSVAELARAFRADPEPFNSFGF
jgi:predicted acetyltransferase